MLRRGARRRGARGGERTGAAENEDARRARGRMPSHRRGRVATTAEPRSAASRSPCRTARVSSVALTKGALGLATPPLRRCPPRPWRPMVTAACTCTPTALRADSSAASVKCHPRRPSAQRHRQPRRSVAVGCARRAAPTWERGGRPSAGVQRAGTGRLSRRPRRQEGGEETGEEGAGEADVEGEEEAEVGEGDDEDDPLPGLPAGATPVAPLRIR